MAVVDVANRTVTLKIVYFGCALGGKTTNLVTLHRLTDPDEQRGMVSIATKDDRTLFFDLLPMDLGQIGGLNIKIKIYTVPGQVHYESTRRQVLAGADGVVMVVDSSASASKPNKWAVDNLRLNLKANALDPDSTPIVLQWNKRDVPDARPVEELEAELNPRRLPTQEAVATEGPGVVETFAAVVKGSISATYAKTGRASVSPEVIDQIVDRALHVPSDHLPKRVPKRAETAAPAFEHRFDMEAYRDEQGRDKRIVDESKLLAEAVKTNMKLAERLDEYQNAQTVSDRRASMMQALGKLAPMLADPAAAALPPGVMAGLLEGASRDRGSMLLFAPKQNRMEEREVVPGGPDPLNREIPGGVGSVAHRFSQTVELRIVEDMVGEVFFDAVPPGAEDLAGALIAPLHCDGLAFGSLIVYSRIRSPSFDSAEREYWGAASTLIGLSLHWRALRRKVAHTKAS